MVQSEQALLWGTELLPNSKGFTSKNTPVKGVVHIDDPKWHGYVTNLTLDEFEQSYASRLPEQITGDDFLARYGGITDTVTRVLREKSYAVLKPTAHPVYENARVHRFAELLNKPVEEGVLRELGELMYESHASYSACGLGSEGTDLLIELVREAGSGQGLYGAKITGGGSGGTVAVLGRRGADQAIAQVASSYGRRTGYHPHLFAGSSPGAQAFGYLKLIGDE